MPNFPPGSDQHVNVGVTPTWIFTANTSATNILRLVNEGRNVLYVGQSSVTPLNGLPVYPGGKPVEFAGVSTLYAVSAVATSSSVGTLAAALPAGSTAFTVGTSTATIVAGNTVMIGTGSSAEPVSVTATGGATTTTFTIATGTLYDHANASPVSAATSLLGQLRVSQGVV